MSIRLKAMVDKKKNKVVFAESDKDFVEVLFSFLTITMGEIARLAFSKSKTLATGSMSNLYGSVNNIDVQLFRTRSCKQTLSSCRRATESFCNKPEGKIFYGVADRFFCCNESKWQCKCGMYMHSRIVNSFLLGEDSVTMFIKGNPRFTISDDLQVISLSDGASLSLLSNLGVIDWSTVEERIFEVPPSEVLDLLLCSSVSRTPLTETLLKHKPIPVVYQASTVGSQVVVKQESKINTNQDQGNITVKLMVSKSKKIVCYAEAKEDFVNFLLSFLAVPIGHILKQRLFDGSTKGCLDHLYKSVVELDDEQCLKSKCHKKMLVSPMLAPGFGYRSDLIGIVEASHPLHYARLDINGTLSLYNAECVCSKIASKAPVFTSVEDPKSSSDGFLKGPAMFTVTDSLIIRPISPVFVISILNELKVPLSDIEEKVVHVGKEEALRLLVASFVSDSALTHALLGKPK